MTETALMTWLSDRFGRIENRLGELYAHQMGNRQTTIEAYRSLTHRMDRLEDRMATAGVNGKSRGRWHRTIMYFLSARGLLFMGATALLVTGHITKDQVKDLILKSLFLH